MYDLSIAIPTFQRETILRKNLDFLLKLIADDESLSERIQVCVSDNGSTDGTWRYLEGRMREHPFLKCVRQAENLRFARNFWRVGLLADGRFVCFAGDDDRIHPDAPAQLLAMIGRFENKQLIMNTTMPGAWYSARRHKCGEALELHGAEDYLDQCGLFFGTFIDNLCFRRDFLEMFRGYADIAEQSAYPHFIPVIRAVKNGAAVVVDKPLFATEDNARQWRKWQRVYTAVDMARLVREELAPALPSKRTGGLLRRLARSLPMACFYYWQEQWRRLCSRDKQSVWCQSEPPSRNPYASCGLINLWRIYFGGQPSRSSDIGKDEIA